MGSTIRTCVACRERTEPEGMIRLVRHPSGVLVVDEKRRLPGRGAWCHVTDTCVTALMRKPEALKRAFKASVSATNLKDDLRQWLTRRLGDGLSLAWASRSAVVGLERMLESMTTEDVACVAISRDISPRTRRALSVGATSAVELVEVPFSSAELGALLGGELYAAVAILRVPATNNVRLRLRQWSALG